MCSPMCITARTLSGPGSSCIFSSMHSDCSARILPPTIKTLFPCDQSHLIIVKDIIPGPVDEHRQPVPESDQAEDVEPDPNHPGDESAERESPNARHRRVPPDRREHSRILVLEWLRAFLF